MIRRNTYRYTSSIEVVMTFSVFFLIFLILIYRSIVTVYTFSALFVTFTSFFFRRLFWKREAISCAVHELINLIIINSECTVMTEQKVSIGL